MKFLTPSRHPEEVIEKLAMAHQPPIRRMVRRGFEHHMAKMPVIDASAEEQDREVALTQQALMEMSADVRKNLHKLNIPEIADGQFGRIILAVEDPKERDGILIPGTEIVLALWGTGFTSPVHGHAPGYIHEDLLDGGFDVHLYRQMGPDEARTAVYEKSIPKTDPGIFYTEFVRDVGQARRSALVHNFRARMPSKSLHYLPEHVRDGDSNRFKVVNRPESGALPSYIETKAYNPGFKIEKSDVKRVTKEEVMQGFKVGDVYLVRSENVAFIGDHYVLITGGLIEKPHGVRPGDITFQIPENEPTPLDEHDISETLVAYKLSDDARRRFYEHQNVEAEYRIN